MTAAHVLGEGIRPRDALSLPHPLSPSRPLPSLSFPRVRPNPSPPWPLPSSAARGRLEHPRACLEFPLVVLFLPCAVIEAGRPGSSPTSPFLAAPVGAFRRPIRHPLATPVLAGFAGILWVSLLPI
jgi:hypothetical protein